MSNGDPFNPFDDEPRVESVGEAQQRLASLLQELARIEDVEITEGERQALAKVIGILFRKWPFLRGLEKMIDEALHPKS